MKTKLLILIIAAILGLCVSVFAQTNVPRGWMDGGGESPIYPAAVDNGYIMKQVAIGTNTAVQGMALTVKGTATITHKLAVGTTTISATSALNVAGTVTATGFVGNASGLTGIGSGDMTAATYDPQTIAGDAFDLALHTGSIAHNSTMITGTGTNSHATIDSHLASTTNPHGTTLTQTAATIAGIAAPYIAQNGGTGTLAAATIAGVAAPYIAQNNGTGTGITLAGDTTFPGGGWNSSGTVTATGFVGNGSQLTGLTNSWANLTGIPTDNGSVTVSAAAGKIPVAGSDGKLDYGWQKDVIRLTGTTTQQAAGAFGQLYVQSSGVSGYTLIGTNTTALMTSATAPSPNIVRESGFYAAGREGWRAFNRTQAEDSRWLIATTTAWLSYDYGTGNAHALYQYNLNTWEYTYAPRDWLFQGSNNNTSWTTLDSQTGQSQAGYTSAYNEYVIALDKRAPYQFYRINISLGNHGTTLDICEMQLIAALSSNYTQYSAKYADPVKGNTVFEIFTPGTATPVASYIYCNATTTVWGLGTNTAITSGTAAGYYAGWSNRPIRVSAVDIASTKEIKENLKEMHIMPEQLEAESRAKPLYIADKKPAWIVANEINYTYVGSDTATYVDTAAMEADYAIAIESAWATDLNQPVYIEAVQKAQEQYFWGLFDKMQPKSWNPKDNLNSARKGFVVEEVPDEIKGEDKQSIDPMALIAYQTLVLQSLKNDTVLIMEELKKLANTGTFTTTVIDKRLEAMRTAP